ncbi:MAG: bifunctional [glutamate--ammonia ligase]-adenylyl-L-tyrosine phosphorylase/[glutamate--ammonia-ligase] adenylyltransferase [Sideroxydans sp.]
MSPAPLSPFDDFDACLRHATACSPYLAQLLQADASLSTWLREHAQSPCDADFIARRLAESPTETEEQMATALRTLRKRVLSLLMLRDLCGKCGLEEVMDGMTALAEIAVQRAQACLMQSLTAQYGLPIGADSGTPQELLVIGMGKLGGGELNVSSDIDLIFIYPEEGDTDGARSLSNHEFFTRLGRRLIGLLNEVTADGFVFRVDMRLRPYGDSGPLVMSFAALEEYLVSQGREWERYAWIKARVIAPRSAPRADELERLVRPFVYRKYLDFGAFDSMRKLHAQIRAEVARKDKHDNIKLGPGGIREIEFIAQVFQLIRGGRDARLRLRPTRLVLRQLAVDGQLDPGVVDQLDRHYVFLRNLEHRLQYLHDQQTQALPTAPEEQARLAHAMNFPDYAALLAALAPLRDFVSRQFETVFGERETAAPESSWSEDSAAWPTRLAELGYTQAHELAALLAQFRESARYRQLPESSHQRMDSLLPQFIALCAAQNNRDDALRRALKLLEAIARRAAYLAFLAEYPQALPRLTRMLAASAWASDYLAQHPILLDELLDTRELYVAPDWPQLEQQLAARLHDAAGDTEREMDVLRHFQQAQTFHLLAMDLQGLLPLEILSDHLSDLADLLLRHALQLAWRDTRQRHLESPRFAVIAYGKLGGKELGYASDLDLVFLYDDPHPEAGQIYARLAQRLNTLLSSHTAAGRLYEVDLRLRPHGDSGLLVSSLAAFEDYQRHHAWVWEHQALTRARFCAGDAAVGQAFEHIRSDILCLPREPQSLRQEIRAMRQKMHDGHPNPGPLFDIKHDTGGMVDIEFMVQYLVLVNAHDYPQLTANTGNLALLALAAQLGLIEEAASTAVREVYRELRRLQHQQRLNQLESAVRVAPGTVDTRPVTALWQALLGG